MAKESDPRIAREALELRRDELQRRCDAIRKDYRSGLSADSGERAVELENAETLAEILRVTELTLAEVEAELKALAP
ncbi:MAG: hypothetical protein AAGA23_06345 [Pseudomonadota bacterium]